MLMNEYASAVPGPAMSECAPTVHRPVMSVNECTLTMPRPVVNEHALTTPTPTLPGLAECTHTVSMSGHTGPTTSTHVVSQPAVPGPTLPEAKPQLATSSLAVHPSTPPASEVTQPQVVLIKQFQQPKPYSGSSSWKGYREYFERLAAVNGWATATQKVEPRHLTASGLQYYLGSPGTPLRVTRWRSRGHAPL